MPDEPTPNTETIAPKKRGRGRPKGTTGIKWKRPKVDQTLAVDRLDAVADELEDAAVQDEVDQLTKTAPDSRKSIPVQVKQQILEDIRLAMLIPMPPREITGAISKKYSVSKRYADLMIERVQSEQQTTVGFARYQLQDLAQRSLVSVLKDKTAKHGDTLKAIEMANNLFNISATENEAEQHQKKMVAELSRRIDTMSLEELDEMQDRILTGKLDALFEPDSKESITETDLAPSARKQKDRLAKRGGKK